MLKLKGWGLRPWMEFEIDPLSGRYLKRRLPSEPTSLNGYAGFGQELKVKDLGAEISMRMGSAAWNLFEPRLELEHRAGDFRCEFSVRDANEKRAVFRYRRKDSFLAMLPSLSRRSKAELVEEWSARARLG